MKEFYKDISRFKELLWPVAVSIFAIGGMCGAFIGPNMAKRAGRYVRYKYQILECYIYILILWSKTDCHYILGLK